MLAEPQHVTTVFARSPASRAALTILHRQGQRRQQTLTCFHTLQPLEVPWSEAASPAPVPSLKCFCRTSRPWCHVLPRHASENLRNGLLYNSLTRTSVTSFQSPPLKQMRIATSSIHTRMYFQFSFFAVTGYSIFPSYRSC